jgi:glycine oxidase
MELLTGEAVQRCEPSLGKEAAEALFMPEVAQVRNPRLLQAMRGSLEVLGVTLSEGHEVKGLKIFGDRVHGVSTNLGEIEAGTVIVAGGAWTARLLAGTGISMPVRPVRGQMLLFQAEPEVVRRIVLDGDRYVIPRLDGRVLVGSTVEEAGFVKETTDEAFETLRESAVGLIPRLGDYPVEHHWAGLRPGSPRGVPYIGPHPELQGLYVNAGHFRNGVVLGLASARLLADLLLGREPILDPAPYAVGRAEP